MTNKPNEIILKVKKKVDSAVIEYAKSQEFEFVAINALRDFINRVKRKLMPDMSQIMPLGDRYKEYRKKNSAKLGDRGKVGTSNATATGQMLEAMEVKMKPSGFSLFVSKSSRSGELDGRKSSLNNYDVAGYYRLRRDIFGFSEPELKRITRQVRMGLLKLIRKSK